MRLIRLTIPALLALVAACTPLGGPAGRAPDKADRLVLRSIGFSSLSGWAEGDTSLALQAFQRSCARLQQRKDDASLGGEGVYGRVGDWRAPCNAALAVRSPDASTARRFFETWFAPAQVLNRDEPTGLYTGYYEPELTGSRKPSSRFHVPLLQRPSDLVQVDLGSFRPALRGERIAGRVQDGKLLPYASRAEIERGAIGSVTQPIVYVDNATAAFFLHIQGSGRVRLDDGSHIRVAYDGQNGHPYTPVGRLLVERGEIARDKLSMQTIAAWLEANPGKAGALMDENASYVFFRELPIADPRLGADGAQGVPLTPEASLAVDLKFHALGVPMWVDARMPTPDAQEDVPLQRLLVAQDTGGAIRGPVRGDVYWGAGAKAGDIAGRMAHKGRLFVLLPKPLAQRLD